MIIGLAGSMGAGKDTVADYLIHMYGFEKRSFADPIRKMAAAINPIIHHDGGGFAFRYNDAVEQYGYVEAKARFPEVRRFLQHLGLEAGRGVLGDNIWVDTALRGLTKESHVVLPDVRFKNEQDAITALDGFTVLVTRPTVLKPSDHATEAFAAEIIADGILSNDSSLGALKIATIEMYQHLKARQAGVEDEDENDDW